MPLTNVKHQVVFDVHQWHFTPLIFIVVPGIGIWLWFLFCRQYPVKEIAAKTTNYGHRYEPHG
jgi:hypothetical protein